METGSIDGESGSFFLNCPYMTIFCGEGRLGWGGGAVTHQVTLFIRIASAVKVILRTFKAIHGFAPKYVSDLISIK